MSENPKDISASMPDGVGALLYTELASTNSTARDMMRELSQPTWIAAKAQTAGRGRMGRTWVSESSGNLYASYLFKPTEAPGVMTALPFVVSLAIVDAIASIGIDPTKLQCKWPNDVLIGGRKTSGVLIESVIGSCGSFEAVIIGIGVNLKSHPSDAQFPATNIAEASGISVESEEFLPHLAVSLEKMLQKWRKEGFLSLKSAWEDMAWGFGAKRRVQTHDGVLEGVLLGLNDDGGLNIKLDDGTQKRLYAGDVFDV